MRIALLALCACVPEEPEAPDLPPLQSRYTLSDEAGFPEGFAYHAGSRSFLAGSLESGRITQIDADGTESVLYTPPEPGWSTLGAKIHPQSGELLICAVRDPSGPDALSELWVIDVQTGQQNAIALQGSPSNCNDVVADGDSVYLTDREASRIHRVDLASETSEVWLDHPELSPQIIGNNGIVLTDSGELIVGQYAPARLLRIPLASPNDISEIALSGEPIGTLPDGADGIILQGEDLLIAANRRVLRVVSDDGWSTGEVSASLPPVGIVALTLAEDRLYGLKGEVVSFVLGTPTDLPFEILELEAP